MAEQKPRIIESPQLVMFTAAPNAEGKRSKLVWGIRNGYPRITVFTNDPNDKGPGIVNSVISAPVDMATMHIFLTLLEQIATGPNDIKNKVDCFTLKWVDGQRTDERILLSEIWIGKDSEGMVWISLIAPARPKIKFTYRVSDWHGIYKTDGVQMTEAEGSTLAALAACFLLKQAYSTVFSGTLNGAISVQSFSDAPKTTDWGTAKSADGSTDTTFDDVFL